jgi:hypothetical protein
VADDVAVGRERVVALPHVNITLHLQLSWNLKLRCKLRLRISLACMTVRRLSGISDHYVALTDDIGVRMFCYVVRSGERLATQNHGPSM